MLVQNRHRHVGFGRQNHRHVGRDQSCHRHIIAVPVMFLAMVMIAAVNASLLVHASQSSSGMGEWTLTAQASARDFSIPLTIAGRLDPGGSLAVADNGQRLRLSEGTAHLRAMGLISVDVPSAIRVDALAADFSLIAEPDAVTVVAVSAPVLATRGDRTWVVPPKHQLRIASSGNARLSGIPGEWLESEAALFRTMQTFDPAASVPQVEALDAAIARGAYADALAAVGATAPDPVSVAPLLSKVLGGDGPFTSDRVTLAFALVRTRSSPLLSALLALRLAQEGERIEEKAASLVVRELASSALAGDLPSAVPLLAAALGRPLVSGIVDQWETETIRLVVLDSAAALPVFREAAPLLPAQYVQAGFPRQAEFWEQAIANVSAVLSPLLPADERTTLERDLQSAHLHDMEDQPTAPSSVTSSAAVSRSDQELLSFTRQLLREHGVMLSTLTTVKVVSDRADTVRVEGVFIAEEGRDVPYAFTVDIAQNRIAEIVRDGVRLPNGLPVSQFFK